MEHVYLPFLGLKPRKEALVYIQSFSWVPLAHDKSVFARKFLIFVWLGCCYSVFFTHTRPCLLQVSYLLLYN